MTPVWKKISSRAGFLVWALAVFGVMSLAACATATPIPSPIPQILPTASIQPTSSPAAAVISPTPPAAPAATASPSPSPTLSLPPTITPTLPPAEPVLRGPYLEQAVPGSMTVAWDTAKITTGWVAYGPTASLGTLALEAGSGLHHRVQLSGLKDYTAYYYQVGGDKTVSSFRSAPAPGQAQFHFAVIGDTRANPDIHSALIAGMAAARPDFALHLGDMVDDGSIPGLWDSFLKIEGPLMQIAPLYPAIGNHEGDSPQFNSIFDLGREGWYAFDYGNARFITLKVTDYNPTTFAAGSDQRAWLEQELAGATGKWVFVSFHVAVHSSFAEDPSEVSLRSQLAPLFERYQVTAVFNGHFHSYERVIANGITYIVTAGGGAPLYSLNVREPGQQAAALVFHYLLIDVNGDTVSGRAIDKDGKVIDTFEIKAVRTPQP